MSEFKVNSEKIAEAIAALTALYNQPDEKQYLKAYNLVKGAAQTTQSIIPVRADKVKKEAADFYSTGVDWLDEWLGGGIRKQEFVLFGAVPFGGKTHLLVWLSGLFALQGAKVAHFVGEDIISDVRDYYLQMLGKKALSNVWLIDVQDYSFTVQGVEQTYAKLKESGVKLDVIVPDHLDIMQSGQRMASDWQDASIVARELRIFAKRNDVMVFSASQAHEYTREQKGIGRFYRAKIGKSGNADVILFVDTVIGQGDGVQEYHMSRAKARGRNLSPDTVKKILDVNWNTMEIEDVT